MNETSKTAEGRPQPPRERLRCLVYVSTAEHDFSESELARLMEGARAYNEALGVTGLLLYADRNIIQCLEGPADAVGKVFERVRSSQRHHGITVLLDDTTAQRGFPDWSMALAHPVNHEGLSASKAQWRQRIRSALDEAQLGLGLMRRFWQQHRL